jgi:hypothetical protein
MEPMYSLKTEIQVKTSATIDLNVQKIYCNSKTWYLGFKMARLFSNYITHPQYT